MEPSDELWVCWRCNGRDDISRVLNLSVDGLFLHTAQKGFHEGLSAKLDFLVQEGRLEAYAAIRHVQRGSGLGLKFIGLTEEDLSRLRALLTRLRPGTTHSAPRSTSGSELSDA